jgi:hypothetical protein|tara:strand:- start:392 stop:652 length:261 start_codon:yes stop_codon:yes gene_type:complete
MCPMGQGIYEGEPMKKDDVVNQPPHYGNGNIECIEYMKDNMELMMFLGYLEGNAKKYMHRYRYKGKPVEDLKKARWYLDRLITEME